MSPLTPPVPDLVLYQYGGCPYCMRVLSVIEQLALEIELRDILSDSASARELLSATGRRTVPVLRIEEAGQPTRWLPESTEIVSYLRARFG